MAYGLVALWLVVYLALLLAGVPIAATLFPRLADRGLGVALPLSAAIIWLTGYWIGQFSLALAVWAGLLTLFGLVIALVYVRDVEIDARVLAETVGVFTVAFLFLIAIRAVDPAVHPLGGEKFLDFGLLQSLLRAETLPPEDMWFADEPVKYYYGGHLLASLLTRLTGTEPQFAYNLALAGFYAMLVTAAYGLAGSITADRGSPRWLGGLMGVFFVGIASNLSTPSRLLIWQLPDGLGGFVAGLFSMPVEGLATGTQAFSYWDASRIIGGTINEFPLFAWLNGDLHAHMMSTPFLLLVATLLYSYYRTPEAEVTRRRLLVLATLPPLAGLLAVVNTWSFPSVGGLTLLTLYFAPSDPRTLAPSPIANRLARPDRWTSDELARLATAGAVGVLVVVIGVVVSGPFWFGTASGRSLGLFPDRSALGPLVTVHGTFLLVFVPYLLRYALPKVENAGRVAVMLLLVVGIGVLSKAPAVALFAPLIAVGWALNRLDAGRAGRATGAERTDGGRDAQPTNGTARATDGDAEQLLGSEETAGAAATESADERQPGLLSELGFESVLLIAGAGLVVLVEFLYVKEQAGPGRMNTVFKTYMQVWVLWGVAAGAALTDLVWRHRPSLALSGGRWKPTLRIFAVVLIAATSIYGGLALTDHFTAEGPTSQTDDPTLNATLFVGTTHADEAPAIRWLDRQPGRPTIVSAPGGYRWNAPMGHGASAAASLTGVPTVVGWHHEIGYRGEEAYERRASDVRTIYTGPSGDQARLLTEYNVSYVYVGPAERTTYGPVDVAQLEGVTVARQWDEVTIYRVDQSELTAAEPL
ncbi:DUF2298 domain-containing protein [Halorientalis brevis]|uniref:DUF2298 domain-containing protein n=1 Tax=Halorientalis brevis TaxID=1126241 RepID=A0ABD6CAD7_9EURY|nr:DUF2298 domain-containing protein [Halorientalis brevis]